MTTLRGPSPCRISPDDPTFGMPQKDSIQTTEVNCAGVDATAGTLSCHVIGLVLVLGSDES